MSFDSLMWNLVDIYRNDLTSLITDAVGGYSRTSSLYLSDLHCNIQLLSGEEMVIYGKNNIKAKYRMYCRPSFEIRSTDLIKYNGDFYEVLMIEDQCSLNHHLLIILGLVKAPVIHYPDSSSSDSSSSSSSIDSSSTSSSSSES